VTTVRTVIHDRRIEVPAPEDLPDGTEVILTIGANIADDEGPNALSQFPTRFEDVLHGRERQQQGQRCVRQRYRTEG
jgi:hypothetical protein